MFENFVSDEKAEFKSCGSAARPYGTSGGPLIFLHSSDGTDVPQYSVIGYGVEYDESGKTITAGLTSYVNPTKIIVKLMFGKKWKIIVQRQTTLIGII